MFILTHAEIIPVRETFVPKNENIHFLLKLALALMTIPLMF